MKPKEPRHDIQKMLTIPVTVVQKITCNLIWMSFVPVFFADSSMANYSTDSSSPWLIQRDNHIKNFGESIYD